MRKHFIAFILFALSLLGACSSRVESDQPTPRTDSIAKVVTDLLVNDDLTRTVERADSADAAGWLSPFDAEMQQRALEIEHANCLKNRTIIIQLIIVMLIIVGFAVFAVIQWRNTRRKNKVLSQEIATTIDYKVRYLQFKSRPDIAPEVKDKESRPHLEMMTDAELFEFLRVVIVGEKLFLDPLFERQQLVTRFGLNKERIGAAFARGSNYGSLPAYINECRLEYGAAQLVTSPEMSIAEIAASSGFSNASVFTRNFRQRYTLSPTEFRVKNDPNHTD